MSAAAPRKRDRADRVTVKVPDSLAAATRAYADAEERSFAAVCRLALRRYFETLDDGDERLSA